MTSCALCSAPKASYSCESCQKLICKKCLETLTPDDFSFFTRKPPTLKFQSYCLQCFDHYVVPERARYDALMERAKEIYFLTKNYRGYVHVTRRHTKRVAVEQCSDRRECILRMAFMAAELDFNAIIEAVVDSSKIRMGGYQSSLWAGSAMPASIDGERLEKASLRGF